MFYFNPLEQFDITIFYTLFNSNLTITNISCMALFNLILLYFLLNEYNTIVNFTNLTYLLNTIFSFVFTLTKDSIFFKKFSLILLLFYMFLFLFISNLIGMIPYSITITSHLILTLYLSLAFFIGTNLIGLLHLKQNYFILFLPDGIPVPIIPALILIEYVSYFSKIFSLAIRLFANMMSGHILLKILIGFSWSLLNTNIISIMVSVLPFFIVFCVIGLEFAIAFLQAYVFTILLIIYLNDVLNPH